MIEEAALQIISDFSFYIFLVMLVFIKFIERSPQWYFKKSMIHLHRQDYVKAKKFVINALKRQHDFTEARLMLAEIYRRTGDYKSAQAVINQTVPLRTLTNNDEQEIKTKNKMGLNRIWPSAKTWP